MAKLNASVAAGIVSALLAFAQDRPLFKADVSLVHVDAEVVDGPRLLTGFQKEDFRVFDNKELQTILYFSQSEEPLDVILLFDVSGSMKPKLENTAATARTALMELAPGDRVAVMTFEGRSKVVQSFTENLDDVEHSIRSAVLGKARGSTRILSAIQGAANYFRLQPRTSRRRAILIVTDNHGLPSGRAASIIRSLWEADASLSGLQIRTPREDEALRSPVLVLFPTVALLTMERMNSVVERTGGDFVKVTGPDAGAEFHELIRRLRLRYTLTYGMPKGKPAEERRIQVVLSDDAQAKNTQARIRARTGYRIPQNTGR